MKVDVRLVPLEGAQGGRGHVLVLLANNTKGRGSMLEHPLCAEGDSVVLYLKAAYEYTLSFIYEGAPVCEVLISGPEAGAHVLMPLHSGPYFRIEVERQRREGALQYPVLIGHRGLGSDAWRRAAGHAGSADSAYFENTLRSFLKSHELEIEMVELDVHLSSVYYSPSSSTRNCIIHHDFTLKDRSIYRIDRAHMEDANIPLLADIMSALPVELAINVEIKYPSSYEMQKYGIPEADVPSCEEYCKEVLEAIDACSRGRKILVSSFCRGVCAYAKNHGRYRTFLLTTGMLEGVDPAAMDSSSDRKHAGHDVDGTVYTISGDVAFAGISGLDGLVLDAHIVLRFPFLASAILEKGMRLYTYGAKNNNVKHVMTQIGLGIEGIITDHISVLSEVLS